MHRASKLAEGFWRGGGDRLAKPSVLGVDVLEGTRLPMGAVNLYDFARCLAVGTPILPSGLGAQSVEIG